MAADPPPADEPVPPVLIRKRMRRYEIDEHLRFLTCSCEGRLPLFNNDLIKQVFAEELAAARVRQRFRLIAWVLMPEHFHLLLWPFPGSRVADILWDLKRNVATRVIARWRELRAPILDRLTDSNGEARFWLHGGGYDRNIFSDKEFAEKFRYIHANPVKRGLVERASDWAWSSARWYAGDQSGPVQVDRL